MKRLKPQTLVIMVMMAQSRNFGSFRKLILALIPKNHFILMTCSARREIYKNSRCHEGIVTQVKTQLNVSIFPDLAKFTESA
jgi:hypothetical protein